MKKLTLLFLSLLAVGAIFQACDNQKTYAEQLEDERKAISNFIKKNNIKVISVAEFEKDTVTNVAENEYVYYSNGVYLQIVKRGEGDTIKNRDEVSVRFIEYDIMEDTLTVCDNVSNEYSSSSNLYPVSFFYTETSSTVYGEFLPNAVGLMSYLPSVWGVNNTPTYKVPNGWLFVLNYIKDGAHIKLIVASKMGHASGQYYVMPYFYDIRSLKVMKYEEDEE